MGALANDQVGMGLTREPSIVVQHKVWLSLSVSAVHLLACFASVEDVFRLPIGIQIAIGLLPIAVAALQLVQKCDH